MESENFSEIGWKSETGGKYIIAPGGMDAPDLLVTLEMKEDKLAIGRWLA